MAADLYPTYVLMAQAAAGGAADDTVTADDLVVTGPSAVLPARFDVTGFAAGAVAAAGVAAARLLAARRDIPPAGVTIDTRAACAAFAAEGLFTPIGWPRPELWDPIAGNYRTSDGWIRLHTNYPYHRAVAERVLGGQDRDAIEKAAAGLAGRGTPGRDRRRWRGCRRHARPIRVARLSPGPCYRRRAGGDRRIATR